LSGGRGPAKAASTRFWLVDPSKSIAESAAILEIPSCQAGIVVLAAVAKADELPWRRIPRHDAAQVGADGVDAVAVDGIAALMAVEPASGRDWATQLVADHHSPAAGRRTGRNEEPAREFKIRWWWRPPKSSHSVQT